MRKSNVQPLQAISPTIDYKEFYSSYHKRKRQLLFLKGRNLPLIRTNVNYLSIDNNNAKRINTFNLPLLSPNKTNSINSTFFPKINTIQPKLKNMKLQLKNRIPKKNGKLSIKYIDLINMNKINKLLIYEITKGCKLEEEITKQIYDPISKNKIIKELNIIDEKTTEEIERIMNFTTKIEKEEAIKFFNNNPKIIYLCAENILKQFNEKNNNKTKITDKSKSKEKKKDKKKAEKGEENNFGNKRCLDFLYCAKNNIIRKIELRNQYNQEISIEYIEMLLRNEIEKIKLIIYKYVKEQEKDNKSFNSDDELENHKERIIDSKQRNELGKSIKRLMKLNNYYNTLIRTNYNEEYYLKNKLMKNEMTQYNGSNIQNNYRYDSNNFYLNKILNDIEKTELDDNMNHDEENKFIGYSGDKRIFNQFKKFSRNKKEEIDSMNSQVSNKSKKNELNGNKIGKGRINTEKIDKGTETENKEEIKNNKLNISKSHKMFTKNEGVDSTNNKDIISLLDRTKYKSDDNIQRYSNQKTLENFFDENQQKIEKNIKENLTNEALIKTYESITKNNNSHEEDKNEDEYHEYYDEENYSIYDEYNHYENSEENKEMSEYDDTNSDENEEEDEDKTNDNLFLNQITNYQNEGSNQNNNNNILLSNEESQNNIHSKNDFFNQNIQKEKAKENIIQGYNNININQTTKKSKPKKRRKKENKISPEKVKTTQEKTESKHVLEKFKIKNNLVKDNNNKYNQRNSLLKKLTNIIKPSNIKNKQKIPIVIRKNRYTRSQIKKIIASKKGRKSNFALEKKQKFKIKNFEVIDKKEIRGRLSFHNTSKIENKNFNKNNKENEVNVIKLQEEDIEQIVNFINDEEKRRIKNEKNAEKKNKEKNLNNNKNDIYSLFKVEEKDNKKVEELTKDDLVEKLTRDDWKVREYIEDIIRAGLTMGNKKLNKQMKNKSLLIYNGVRLGEFKFKKNFGIKDEFDFEQFRPLSHHERIKLENNKNKANEKTNNKNKIEEEEKRKKEKEIERQKEKERKLEEAKKKLIYDNSYLFEKRKPSIIFILRKEVEEILHGGILLQQLTKAEEEKEAEMKNKFVPSKRKKFVKKKKKRGKLFRKSFFFRDVIGNNELPKDNNYSSSDSVIKEESNNSFEEKMETLINRIKKLKKGEELNINEIDQLINKKDIRNQKEKEKEIRMQGFLHTLNEYRDMNYNQRKNKDHFSYKVPILIRANSDIDGSNCLNISNK